MSVAEAIEYIKGKSTLLIFERHAAMKYKYGQSQFWYGNRLKLKN